MVNLLKTYLKKLFSDLHSAIIGILLGIIFLGLGSIWAFSKHLWFQFKFIIQMPTPLWLAVSLFLLLLLFIYRIRADMNLMAKGQSGKGQQGPVAQSPEYNVPGFFPALNEATLKKHVALAASHCRFENDISCMYLYEGTPFKYQLVVIAKNTKDLDGVKRDWGSSLSNIFEKHFTEVYLKELPQNFWSEWNILVVLSLDEIPDDLILKRYRWVVY